MTEAEKEPDQSQLGASQEAAAEMEEVVKTDE